MRMELQGPVQPTQGAPNYGQLDKRGDHFSKEAVTVASGMISATPGVDSAYLGVEGPLAAAGGYVCFWPRSARQLIVASRPSADPRIARKRTFKHGDLRDASMPSIEACVSSIVRRGETGGGLRGEPGSMERAAWAAFANIPLFER
jgi:hypothetical protein